MNGKENEGNMGTAIRPELSKKNKYWIDRHRYYELKHFCLQYKLWRDLYLSIDGMATHIPDWMPVSKTNLHSDPTAVAAKAKAYYRERIKMVDDASKATDPDLGSYIFLAVTEGRSYESVDARYSVPCSRDTFYDRYRKFFWILNQMRK